MTSLKTILVGAALLASPRARASDAPEFLLGDVGVRVDLPRGWTMTRWSDWDFKAEAHDKSVMLFAWATPVQVPISDRAPEAAGAWAKVFEAKVTELGGTDPRVETSTVETVGGRPVALNNLVFAFGTGGASGAMYGATIEVAGQNLQVAVAGSRANARKAEGARAAVLERLEVRAEGEPLEVATTTVTAEGVTVSLPEGWRPPFPKEEERVGKLVGVLGIQDPSACALGLRPRAAGDPDVMATCRSTMQLGVVDPLTFADVEPTVRSKIFGKVEVPSAAPLDLADRTGFLYTPDMGAQGIAVAVVPYDRGVALTWVLGPRGDPTLGPSAEAAARGSAYSGAHPVSNTEQMSYYLRYRPLHPYVLVPGLLGLGCAGIGIVGVGGALILRARRQGTEGEAH